MSDILTSVSQGVGTITLNRPDRRNALSPAMVDGLSQALTDMEADSAVGAVLLTGAGGAFCSGGDVQEFEARGGEGGSGDTVDKETEQQQLQRQLATVGRLYRFPKPVVAALPGAVAGAGMGFALAADLRIGSPRTLFATAFAGVGLGGDFGVAWLLHQLVGPAKARELMFLSPRVRGEECLQLGLVNTLVEEDQLNDRAVEIATQLAHGPSAALAAMKQNLLQAPHSTLEDAMGPEVARHKETGLTQDHKNAVSAFVQKQTPTFSPGWHEGASS
ncbi:enoyl-CoA hydratase [Nesterenkonia salmonea]|uniref:Enoyl-CoA hydratase n=1 Tax=Nesterenkonia salmonea TaxID=1804987 RepID=A0A5R9B7W2_9MICC|nr:enoyl-CoA hydratase [Nesterenkonia salmonea]TLP93672.1 enoyl-CoA hydratase [Nesterenkonia salmonea]